MLGLRGFPGVQGGVETHAQHLCPLLAAAGCHVEVIVRSAYQPPSVGDHWQGVRFRRLWAPKSKGLEAIVHSFLGVLYAGLIRRPDVLHIQAIGPAVMTPLARLFGLRVVVTHHGPDYDRQKWGQVARWVLQLGERFGMRWSHGRIVISEVIRGLVRQKHGRESTLIPNGVVLPDLPDSADALAKFGLDAGRYVVLVSRLVPEKRHFDLIRAFDQAALPGWKLAIVGASDHPDEYVRSVIEAAKATPGTVCTGLQTGEALRQLYAHAGIFVLPSSHEGLPIALLEALSYGLPVVASDIPANLEVGLPAAHYFPLGDTEALAERLRAFAAQPLTPGLRNERRAWVKTRFDWHDIARRTLLVYQAVVKS
ncbi:glycosyltransferase [Parasulfuritortus cantonensis]|uniref:Glycosyltransferase n=1 Tax=Parasulfuritortus cantonensis TaxID=2528202 RepID=A0A4R1BL37_9PROT|nr:glycosyltransferase family 4 protein [Parasulfuritortus cantonensis]TCJ18046.1 glycosyltransferase [Parasulfuritortus cantonensis]